MAIKQKIRHLLGLLILLLMVILPFTVGAFQRGATKPAVLYKIDANNKKAKFSARFPIKYKVAIVNNLKTDQEGTLVYTVVNSKGEDVLTNSMDVRVNSRKKLAASFEVPLDIEGAYQIKATLETNDYNETLTENFSYVGPPIKSKDRKNSTNPYSTAWAADKLSENSPAKTTPLNVESTKDAEVAPIEEDGPEEEGELIPTIKASKGNALYYDKEDVKYSVTINNRYKSKQKGSFTIIVEDELGNEIGEKKTTLKLGRRGIKKFNVTLPKVSEAGVYNVKVAINTNSYDDTSLYAFGYNINKIARPVYVPPDFDDFWKNTMDELAKVDPQYKITRDDGLSTKYNDVYRVDMMSFGNVPFFGYLSVPKLPGKFPVVVAYGGYKKDVPPLLFGDFISFSVNVRGLDKKSFEPFNPDNKEQIILNIENKEEYVYRGIYMDCVRAVDFIFSHGDMKMDLTRVIAFGGSQGASLALVAAAFLPTRINSVVASNPVFSDWKHTFDVLKKKPEIKFPINKIVDYIDNEKQVTEAQVFQTLHYFDLQNFTPKVKASVCYAVGLLDEFVPPGSAFSAYFKLSPFSLPKSELYVFPKLGHEIPATHAAYMGIWFTEKAVKSNKK